MEHDQHEYDSVSTTVIEALSHVADLDPLEFDVPLYEYIDTDALDSLYRHTGETDGEQWTFQFAVDGLTVTVDSDGVVDVADATA